MKNFASLALLALMSTLARADSFPTRTVTLVAPFAAGGGVDSIARPMAEGLHKVLNRAVIVENRPGNATNLGSEQVSRAEPDGHTLLINLDIMAMYPLLYAKLTYRIDRDLRPISYVASSPMVLVVHPALKVDSLKGFVELAKKDPNSLTFAAPGLGTSHHLAFELLSYHAGFKIQNVGYRGGGPALNDVIAGHVNVGVFTIGTAMPYIESGKLRALAVTGPDRSPLATTVPTFREEGFPGAELSNRYILMAPGKTPDEVVDILYRAVGDTVRRPDVAEAFQRQGYDVMLTTPSEAEKMLVQEFKRWEPIVKNANIRVE